MAANEMSTAKTFAIIFGVMLIGPVMFIWRALPERQASLRQSECRRHRRRAVRSTLGPPGGEAREKPTRTAI